MAATWQEATAEPETCKTTAKKERLMKGAIQQTGVRSTSILGTYDLEYVSRTSSGEILADFVHLI